MTNLNRTGKVLSDESIRRIREDDKRRAARHEAAHVVVAAINDGVVLNAYIKETGTDDVINNKTWIGQTHGFPMRTDGTVSLKRSPAVGAAGLAAECLLDDPYTTGAECVEDLEYETQAISDTDQLLLPLGYEERVEAFDVAIAILKKNHQFFDWATNELYKEGDIFNYDVAEYLANILANMQPTD